MSMPPPIRPPPLLAADADIAVLAIFVAVALFLSIAYFLPVLIAQARGHPNTIPIFLVNLFLGPSFVGWVVALCWALTAIESRRQTIVVVHPPPLPRRGRSRGSSRIRDDFDFD